VEHGREGLLIEPGDVAGLRDAIRQLLRDDKERRQMGVAAQKKVDRHFSARAIMPKLHRLYEEYCEKEIEPNTLLSMTNRKSQMGVKRIELLGVPVDCVTMDQALDCADFMMHGHQPCTILAVNPEKVIRAQQNVTLLDQLRGADLLIPDGIGVVFAARLLGLGHAGRVPGSELMPKLCERAAS